MAIFNSYVSHYQRVDGLEASIVKAWHRPRCGTTVTKTVHRFMKGDPAEARFGRPERRERFGRARSRLIPKLFFLELPHKLGTFQSGHIPIQKGVLTDGWSRKTNFGLVIPMQKIVRVLKHGVGHLRGSRLSSLVKHFLGGNWKGSKTKL